MNYVLFVSVDYTELEMTIMDEEIMEQQSRASPWRQNKPGAEENHSPGWGYTLTELKQNSWTSEQRVEFPGEAGWCNSGLLVYSGS